MLPSTSDSAKFVVFRFPWHRTSFQGQSFLRRPGAPSAARAPSAPCWAPSARCRAVCSVQFPLLDAWPKCSTAPSAPCRTVCSMHVRLLTGGGRLLICGGRGIARPSAPCHAVCPIQGCLLCANLSARHRSVHSLTGPRLLHARRNAGRHLLHARRRLLQAGPVRFCTMRRPLQAKRRLRGATRRLLNAGRRLLSVQGE